MEQGVQKRMSYRIPLQSLEGSSFLDAWRPLLLPCPWPDHMYFVLCLFKLMFSLQNPWLLMQTCFSSFMFCSPSQLLSPCLAKPNVSFPNKCPDAASSTPALLFATLYLIGVASIDGPIWDFLPLLRCLSVSQSSDSYTTGSKARFHRCQSSSCFPPTLFFISNMWSSFPITSLIYLTSFLLLPVTSALAVVHSHNTLPLLSAWRADSQSHPVNSTEAEYLANTMLGCILANTMFWHWMQASASSVTPLALMAPPHCRDQRIVRIKFTLTGQHFHHSWKWLKFSLIRVQQMEDMEDNKCNFYRLKFMKLSPNCTLGVLMGSVR